MAFFKFRFPGQSESAEAVNSGPNENIEVVRRRARHRLIGAVVLVLFAVVGFPLIFDTQPRPVSVDTPILIPDRQNASPLSSTAPIPSDQAPAQPLLSPAQVDSVQSSLDTREEVVGSTPVVSGPKADISKTKNSEDKSINKDVTVKNENVVKEELKSVAAAKTEKSVLASKGKEGAEKAQALLDGKSDKASVGRVVIQVGAFSDTAKIRDVRNKLEQAGLKTYTQLVDGKDGKSTTRVRVGPFETREEAEKAAARIRKLNLPAAFLTL
jgi:DedD protein